MSQRHVYLADATTMEVDTTVLAVREHAHGQAVAVQDNVHRPAGGGEPADRGTLVLADGNSVSISRVEKSDGHTWLVVERGDTDIALGMPVIPRVDADYRNRKRQLHTLIHSTLAVAVLRLPGLSVEIADISIDGGNALVVGSWNEPVSTEHCQEIDKEVRRIVLQSRPVTVDKAKSLEHARQRFGSLFRLSARHQLSGRLRLIVIENLDANPCSGTHFDTTGVGPYEMIRQTRGYATNQFAVCLRLTNSWMYWYGPEQ